MTIKQISEKSGLKPEVAESLYWKSIWLREAKPDEKIQWRRLLFDKRYRLECAKPSTSLGWKMQIE